MIDIKKRIAHNVSTHTVKTDKGRTVTVKSSDKYVTEHIVGNAVALAFARVLAGKGFAK